MGSEMCIRDRLDASKIANAALNSVADLSDHPFLRNTKAVYKCNEIDMAGLPVPDSGGEPSEVPDLGAHSDAIRHEFEVGKP